MINKKHIIGLILIILMSIAMVSAVESVSAAKYKKIDSGKAYDKNVKTTWTTYYNGKSIKQTVTST